MYNLWERLNTLQPSSGTQYDAIVGFVSDNVANGSMAGYCYPNGVSTVVSTSSQSRGQVVAHEIAHVFEVGDEYNGGTFNPWVNKPPYGYKGVHWYFRSTVVYGEDKSIKPGPLNSGSLVSENLHPFELGKRNLLKDKDSFMGYSVGPLDTWVTPDIWKELYESFDPKVKSNRPQDTDSEPAKALIASGIVRSSGDVELTLPWRSIITTDEIEVQDGDYEIQALDKTGSIMAVQRFSPSYVMLSDPPMELEEGLIIDVQIPFLEGATEFTVTKDNAIVGRIPISNGIPVINIISPQGGEEHSDTIPIEWEGSDSDGDVLYYTIEYSCDGMEWIVLESEFRDSKLIQNTDTLPGGETAKIRVTASDGINFASTESNTFTLPYKTMEVTIEEPIIEAGTVFLQGRAYDYNEGGIYEDNLTWTSDKDGEIGKGSALRLSLSEGKHTITLNAVNERNEHAKDSIEVNIEKSIGQGGWLHAIWQWLVGLFRKIFKI